MMMMVMMGEDDASVTAVKTHGTNKYVDAEGVVMDWVFDGLYCITKGNHYLLMHERANKKAK